MKCPFWHKLERRTEPRFDSAGKKIGEEHTFELNHEDCKKNECQLYDTETKLCSIPAADKKQAEIFSYLATALPARLKSDFDSTLFEKAEMLSVVFSTGINHLQDALKSYNDLIAKNLEQLQKETASNHAEIAKRLKETREQEKTLIQTLTRISTELETIGAWAPMIDRLAKRGEVLERALVDVVTFLAKPKK